MILVPTMEFLKDMMEFRLILYGLLMIFVMIYYPGGWWVSGKALDD